MGCRVISLALLAFIVSIPSAVEAEVAKRRARGSAGGNLAGNKLLTGNGLLARGLYDEAIAEYEEFLSQSPSGEDGALARYGLGVCYYRRNRLQNAIEALSPLIQVREFRFGAEVATLLGQCHLALGQFEQSISSFSVVANRYGKHDLADDAAAGLIESLYHEGAPESIEKHCRQFVKRWPQSDLRERVEFFWASDLIAQGAYEQAARRLAPLIDGGRSTPLTTQLILLSAQCHQQLGDLESSDRLFRRVLADAPNELGAEALMGLGESALQSGRAAAAGEHFDRFLSQHDQHELTARVRLLRARAWFDLDEYDKAKSILKPLAETDGEESAHAAYWLAKCDMRLGNHAEAADALAAVERGDGSMAAEVQYDRAVALVRSAKHGQAIDVLESFLEKFPGHVNAVDALLLLASTKHRTKNFDGSMEHARELRRQHQGTPQASEALLLIAENQYAQRQFDPAIRAYREFIKIAQDASHANHALFRLGMALYHTGKLDAAIVQLSDVLDRGADDAVRETALLALGDIYFRQSKWRSAEETLGRYLGNRSGGSADAAFQRAIAVQRQGRNAEALQLLDQFLATHATSPHHGHAMFERGQVLLATGNTKDARAQFERLLETDTGEFSSMSKRHLAAIAMNDGAYEAAESYYQEVSTTTRQSDAQLQLDFAQAQAASGNYDGALQTLDDLLDQSGDITVAQSARASRVVILSRLDHCRKAVKAAASVLENHTALPRAAVRGVLFAKAQCDEQLGAHEQAEQGLRTIIGEGIDDDYGRHASLDLAVMLAESDRHDEIVPLLEPVRAALNSGKAQPGFHAQLAYRLAHAYFETGRFEKTVELLSNWSNQFGQSELTPFAYYLCGSALIESAQAGAAAPYFIHVLEHYPSSEPASSSMLRLGESYAVLQNWRKSEAVFLDYLARFPDKPLWFQARFGVGWARENMKRYEEAVSAYEQVVSRHQGETAARAQFQIGECLFAQESYDQAVRALLKVDILYAYPKWSAAALYEAGRCYERLGKPVEARKQFKAVFEKHAKTKWATLAAKKLSELSAAAVPGR